MPKASKSTRFVIIGLLMGLILSSLDQTIISTAMPTLVEELDGFSLYSWVFAVYMLASTTTMPIYGKLADIYGRRKMYLTGMFLFQAGSGLCGIAENMTQLIVFRGIQGLGAGALLPVAFTIVGDLFSPEQRGKFMGLFGTVFGLSSMIGPTLGGLIVEHWSWGWIFLINIPIGVPALIIIYANLKESRSEDKRSIDWFGAIIFSLASVSILVISDALKGLFNRFYLYTTVTLLINENKVISVIFFDLDNFKKLNDTRGHEEGDKALKAVASILKEEAEEVGIAGRYSGEEMVILVDDPDVDIDTFAERIRERIEDETIVTASMGYSTIVDGDSTDSLIKKADKAMYVSKMSGKNRVHGFANLTEEQLALLQDGSGELEE